MKAHLLGSAMLSIALVAPGCGKATCEDVCQTAEACEEGQTREGCTLECEQFQDVADAAGCGDAFDDFVDCVDGAEDICNAQECEAFDLTGCTLDYCKAHPDDAACDDNVTCTLSVSGIGAPCSVGKSCSEAIYSLSCDEDESCTCSKDGVEEASVPFDPAFCDGDVVDPRVSAAASACAWPSD